MDDLAIKIGLWGGGGVFGAILGCLGFKSRLDGLQTEIKTLKTGLQSEIKTLKECVRYEDTCTEVHRALNARLLAIETMQKEIRADIKELIRR